MSNEDTILEEEFSETLSVLPNKFDDRYEKLSCSWNENLVRLATINDNSLCHALLKGLYPVYQNILDSDKRREMVSFFRHDLAQALDFENKMTPNYTYHLTSGRGYFVNKMIEELLNFEAIKKYNIDFSLRGLQSFYNSNIELGEESYEYLSDILNIDIYIVNLTKDDVILNYSTALNNKDRKAVVIGLIIKNNEKYYETIAFDNGEYFQTFFESDHEIISYFDSIKDRKPNPNFDFLSFLKLKVGSLSQEKKEILRKNVNLLDENDLFYTTYQELF